MSDIIQEGWRIPYMQQLLDLVGLPHVLDFARTYPTYSLKEKADTVNQSDSLCHHSGHAWGWAAMTLIPHATLHDAIEVCGTRCGGGCMHGALEAYIMRAFDDAKAEMGEKERLRNMMKVCPCEGNKDIAELGKTWEQVCLVLKL